MVTKTSRVLVACICVLLVAAVAVAVVYVLFHPKKTETSRIIKELKDEMYCLECPNGDERNTKACLKCFTGTESSADDCELDDTRLNLISSIVSVVKQRSTSLTDLLKKTSNSWLQDLKKFRLDAARPSAHWYLKRGDTTKQMKASDQKYAKISPWVSHGKHPAHSKNGMMNRDNEMEFDKPGWYYIYFQTEIHSNDSTPNSRYHVRAVLNSNANREKRSAAENYLMHQEETVNCALKHQNRHHGSTTPTTTHDHPCVRLKSSVVHKVSAGDTLKLEADIPFSAHFGVHMSGSKSYFGALYLHQI